VGGGGKNKPPPQTQNKKNKEKKTPTYPIRYLSLLNNNQTNKYLNISPTTSQNAPQTTPMGGLGFLRRSPCLRGLDHLVSPPTCSGKNPPPPRSPSPFLLTRGRSFFFFSRPAACPPPGTLFSSMWNIGDVVLSYSSDSLLRFGFFCVANSNGIPFF